MRKAKFLKSILCELLILLIMFGMLATPINAFIPTNHTSTITFNTAGGSAIAPITQDEGAAVTAPANPTKAGYTFDGWVPAVPGIMPVDDVTCVAQWKASISVLGDGNELSANIELIAGRYNTTTKVFTPLAAGEEILQNEIIAVRIVPTSDYLVGASNYVVMFDKTLFTIQGSNTAAFRVNSDIANIDYDNITTKTGYTGNHYYDFACSGYSGSTFILDASWPASFLAGEKFDTYKAIKVGTQADSNSLNAGYPEVLPGSWLFQFQLKANSDITAGTNARIWMDSRWFRSSTNAGVDGYIPKCLAGDFVTNASNSYNFSFNFSKADIKLALPSLSSSSTISFDSAGGTAVAPITQDEGTAVTAPADPTKAVYAFTGWTPTIPATMPVADITCVAQWVANTSTITFDSAGGSAVAPITQDEGAAVTAPADPTKAGYTFTGWTPAVPATMPVGDMTCTAQWLAIPNPTSTITFDTAGGNAIAPITKDEGAAVTAPSDPTRAGYTFKGWTPAVPSNMPVADITCTATWEAIPIEVIVIVNGEEQDAGRESQSYDDDTLIITVDVNEEIIEERINEIIEELENDPTLERDNIIEVPATQNDGDKLIVSLTGDIVKIMEDNDFTLSVKKEDVEYIIPAEEITIEELADELGVAPEDLEDIEVEVRITNITDPVVLARMEQFAELYGDAFIFPPVEFEVFATITDEYGNTTEVEVDSFSNYVERIMEIPAGVDPSMVTTGIVFNADGSYNHVPTTVFQKDGKWYARLSSLTNSAYSIVYSPVIVESVNEHWSKIAVNDMASRLIISNAEFFRPDAKITRAIFVEYLTKGLGLFRDGLAEDNQFKDVSVSTAYSNAITIAKNYGIIIGYPDGTFRSSALITREEAIVMFQRAMIIVSLASKDNDKYLDYADFSSISNWALASAKAAVSVGVFNGTSDTTLSPKDNLTYAEAATAIRNLLIIAGLINE